MTLPILPRKWDQFPVMPEAYYEALKKQNVQKYMCQILYNRGLKEPQDALAFLEGRIDASTDPFGLRDMGAAVVRLRGAVERHEPVAVYGDYDVDGVTATVLMVEALRIAGIDARPYIPNRFDEGYGLNNEALDALAQDGVRLVITVDCGVRSLAEIEHGCALGLDMIISDHHTPGPELPKALAVINPKQPGDRYPDKTLAGVGLAYKMIQAYFQAYPQEEVTPEDWLDLVALGTVADMAPLVGENRELVAKGLNRIRLGKGVGLAALAGAAGISLEKVTSQQVGFTLGPRLNASGRLETAMAAFDLLVEADPMKAGELAQKINVQNFNRQALTRDIQNEVEKIALKDRSAPEKGPLPFLIYAASPEFGEGVLGLAASRLVDAYYRPAIVCHNGEDETRGSCRSIPEFDINAALDECDDLLVRHGGHKAAAGFTVRNENLAGLVERLQQIALLQLGDKELRPTLRPDYLATLEKIDAEEARRIYDDLQRLQPLGMGNSEPLFVSMGVQIRNVQTVGKDRSHLKFMVTCKGTMLNAIAFGQGQWAGQALDKMDLVYTIDRNDFNGTSTIQLNVKDLRPPGS